MNKLNIFQYINPPHYYYRANIHVTIKTGKATVGDDLRWYINMLKKLDDKAPKAIVFCRYVQIK